MSGVTSLQQSTVIYYRSYLMCLILTVEMSAENKYYNTPKAYSATKNKWDV